jgi:hypothetical protein
MYGKLSGAVSRHLITENTIDESLARSLTHLFWLGYFDQIETVGWAQIGPEVVGSSAHQRMNFEAALQVRKRAIKLATFTVQGDHICIINTKEPYFH